MNAISALWLGATGVLLAAGLSGCSSSPHLATLPSAGSYQQSADCRDISGTYRASGGGTLLPFFLFGVLDTASPEWAALVELTRQLRSQSDDAVVTIRSPGPDQLEVLVAVQGVPRAKQVLARSRASPAAAEWWGQGERSFRCERDTLAIAGAQVVDWDEYLLPESEKKRRYRRPGTNDVGTARGVYRFSRAVDGSLVMQQQIHFCLGACETATDGRWEPVRGTRSGAEADRRQLP